MKKTIMNKMCIVRGNGSGVYFGKVVSFEKQEVTLEKCRLIHYWEGACSCIDLADIGSTKIESCHITREIDSITLTDVNSVIPMSKEAIKVLSEASIWSMKK